MRPIGFSTGAIAKSNFRYALTCLQRYGITVVELSALRLNELEPLVQALDDLDLAGFEFVSFHAPSRFSPRDEDYVVDRLQSVAARGIPVVVHPDVIFKPALWESMGASLLIENMDKRKAVGRTAASMQDMFDYFPRSRFCFDLGHARQVDPTMTEARLILESQGDRLAEVHISEVNTGSRHDPLSEYAVSAFRSVASLVPEHIPVVLETLIDQGQSDVLTEVGRARRALDQTVYAAG